MASKKNLAPEEQSQLIKTLQARFENNRQRHQNLDWTAIQKKMEALPEKLWSLNQMEETGGEPDVIGYDKKTDEYIFCDCSPESPAGRRSLCYDREALDSRKASKKPPLKTEALIFRLAPKGH